MSKNQAGKNLTYLRQANQGLVLKNLLIQGSSSRQELSSSLGLTKMTITNIVNDLLARNIVGEMTNETASGIGRKPSRIFLNSNALFAIGVHVSRASVCSFVTDITGNLVERIETPLNAKTTRQSLTAAVKEHIHIFLNNHGSKPIIGIGVASIGLVDSKKGVVVSTTNFYDISDWSIGPEIRAEFSLPVYVVNDMKAAALAEYYYGNEKSFSSFAYLGLTSGIGSGIILNGELFEGGDGFTGAIGHMSIHKDGPLCPCGNRGCLELYASVPNVLKSAGCETWDDFLHLFDDADLNPAAERFIADLGVALTNIVNIFNPEAIFLGHEGAQLGSYCYEKLRIAVNASSLTRTIRKVEILPSSLNEKVRYLDAIAAIVSPLLSGEIALPL